MDQSVMNAMKEFIEPGSSIPLDAVIDAFANMCNNTKSASFTITKNIKTKKWKVSFTGARKQFVDDDLRKCVIDAGQYLYENRKKLGDEYRLTLN